MLKKSDVIKTEGELQPPESATVSGAGQIQ